MKICVKNNTNKTIIINYENEIIETLPNQEKNFEVQAPALIELNCKNNKKTFMQRIKEDFSINEIDINHFRFKIKYSSYLKTVVDILPSQYKKKTLEINESIYLKNNVLELRSFEVGTEKNVDRCTYKCVNKQHKLSMYFSCMFAIMLKYGIIGIIGLLCCVVTLFDLKTIESEGTGAIICYLVAFVIVIAYFVAFLIKSIELLKIIKDI